MSLFAWSPYMVIVGLVVLDTTAVVATKVETRNVYGEPLEPCSKAGMGNTGFARDGTCIHVSFDEGCHNTCLDIPSVTGGDFCSVTGQRSWCNSTMPCTEDTHRNCPVAHW